MLAKFFCFIFGHYFSEKMVTRNDAGYFKYDYVRLKFCPRCGVDLGDSGGIGR